MDIGAGIGLGDIGVGIRTDIGTDIGAGDIGMVIGADMGRGWYRGGYRDDIGVVDVGAGVGTDIGSGGRGGPLWGRGCWWALCVSSGPPHSHWGPCVPLGVPSAFLGCGCGP